MRAHSSASICRRRSGSLKVLGCCCAVVSLGSSWAPGRSPGAGGREGRVCGALPAAPPRPCSSAFLLCIGVYLRFWWGGGSCFFRMQNSCIFLKTLFEKQGSLFPPAVSCEREVLGHRRGSSRGSLLGLCSRTGQRGRPPSVLPTCSLLGDCFLPQFEQL